MGIEFNHIGVRCSAHSSQAVYGLLSLSLPSNAYLRVYAIANGVLVWLAAMGLRIFGISIFQEMVIVYFSRPRQLNELLGPVEHRNLVRLAAVSAVSGGIILHYSPWLYLRVMVSISFLCLLVGADGAAGGDQLQRQRGQQAQPAQPQQRCQPHQLRQPPLPEQPGHQRNLPAAPPLQRLLLRAHPRGQVLQAQRKPEAS